MSTPKTRIIEFITNADIEDAAISLDIPWGTIGEIVDIRTYRRWLPDMKRRETALERWQRVINYNLNLVADVLPHAELRTEALLMLDKFSQLKADVSGRTKWVGGTDSAYINPSSQFNCSATAINRVSAFIDAFNLLLNGCGVGFRVFQSDISKLPSIYHPEIELIFEPYNPLPKAMRDEFNHSIQTNEILYLKVGDSKQGWTEALLTYLEAITNPKYSFSTISFNFDSVRPIGERINGFGGTASGHGALQGIIQDVQAIVRECVTDRLRSIDCMDIVCAIAKGVVAGSSRRSALICLFEENDELCANAKKGLYTNPDLAGKAYRSQSNNTAMLKTKPNLSKLKQLLETCRTEGEPGFNNYSKMIANRESAAKKYRPDNPVEWYTDVLTNPCSEINLSGGKTGTSVSFCNLTTLPLPNFITDGVLNKVELFQCVRLNVRSSMRQTCVEFPNSEWTETQSDERLLGISITGWQDAFSLLGYETRDYAIDDLLWEIRKVANDEATRYANRLDIPRPLLVTTIKPEGTASQIFGVSNGLHWDWSPYYIRRVRMTAMDALAQTLLDEGFSCYPETYDLSRQFNESDPWKCLQLFDSQTKSDQRAILNSCNTVVFEFPVKSYSTRTQADVSAITQLESLKAFTKHYCDHMPSVTISVKDGEWDEVAEWVNDNWDDFITASFFPYYGGSYPLLPYEAITEEVYHELTTKIPSQNKVTLFDDRIRYTVNETLLNYYEVLLDTKTDSVLESDCNSGACPIR